MPTLTSLFISSVAQDSLSPTRNEVFRIIHELGHAPEMYEQTFGPWPSQVDGIMHCIHRVASSDLYCLLLHNKGGTYDSRSKRSVTHLEFIEACHRNKVLILFVESTIKAQYFAGIRSIIFDFVQHYYEQNQRTPQLEHIYDHLLQLSAQHTVVPLRQLVDPYVWVFLYDMIDIRKKYVEELNLGVAIPWKAYLSDLLRQGAQLLPYHKEAKESMATASAFTDFSELTLSLLSKITYKEITNWNRFLASLRNQIVGAEISQAFAGYTQTKIGDIRECCAISVFYREEQYLRIKAADGDTDGNEFFQITDEHSFVAITYNLSNGVKPLLFYLESKQMFYLTYKVKEYVVAYHFPVRGDWNQQKFMDFNENIIDGIMNAHANSLLFNFVTTILGGLPND